MLSRQRVRSCAGLLIASLAACSNAGSGPQFPADASGVARHAAASTRAAAPFVARSGGGIDSSSSSRSSLLTLANSWVDRPALLAAAATMAHGGYLLFVSNALSGTIDIYKSNEYEPQHPNQAMLGEISIPGHAGGLYVDSKSNLWVVGNASGHGTIYEYNVSTMPAPEATLDAPYNPQGVAVDSQGVVYVANNAPDQNGNVGVSVYAKGATTPYETLSDPSFKYAEYPAVDAARNVYLGYYDGTSNNVGVFKAGSSAFTKFALPTQAYQPRIDRSGNLLVEDEDTGLLNIYPNGSSSPSSSIAIAQTTTSNNNYAYFDLVYGNQYLFADDLDNRQGSSVFQYTYPGGTLVNTISHVTTYELGIVTAPAPPYPATFTPAAATSSSS